MHVEIMYFRIVFIAQISKDVPYKQQIIAFSFSFFLADVIFYILQLLFYTATITTTTTTNTIFYYYNNIHTYYNKQCFILQYFCYKFLISFHNFSLSYYYSFNIILRCMCVCVCMRVFCVFVSITSKFISFHIDFLLKLFFLLVCI